MSITQHIDSLRCAMPTLKGPAVRPRPRLKSLGAIRLNEVSLPRSRVGERLDRDPELSWEPKSAARVSENKRNDEEYNGDVEN
jgi:hypothetical protein